MPLTIKTGYLNAKGENGTYIRNNTVAEQSTAEQIADIEAAGVLQIDAIDTKTQQSLASISDVSELEDMIAGVFNAANNYTAGQYVIQEVSGVNKLYRFNADYTANDGWSNANVTLINLGGEVSDLKSAISVSQTYVFEIGSIASADGQDMSRNDRIQCKPFYAMSGQIFSVSTEENLLALFQYDYNGNYVRMVTDGSFLSTATAPENGVYRIVMKKDASGSTITESDIPSIVAKLSPSSVAFPGVRILQNEIDDILQEDINEIKDAMVFINNDEFTIHSNKYANYSEGKLSSYTGSQAVDFPVCQGLKFVYSYTKNNPDSMGLYFVNTLGVYLTGYQAIAQAQTITVPENAVRCFATIAETSNIRFLNTGNVFLEKVSEPNTFVGLTSSVTPLESLTDNTGMLDIFLHVGCIGDSLASGESYWNEGGTAHAQDFYQYSWGQYLARKTGNTYYNWSSGGQSTRTWLQSSYATECFDGQHLCEAYIIGLGQNDANYNYTIGSSADIDLADYNNNADSFYGSYGKIIQKIKEVQPQAKIFVITDPNASTNTKGYNAPIRDMANIFDNVYVIDMREYALKYMRSPVVIAQSRDSHFNAYGYKLFAVMIANYIDWIVTHNYTEFTQVELIGTGHSWVD